jgi:hypothetical protein
MLLRPRKHPRSADEPISPAEIAESLFAMGLMAWIIAPAAFLWAPPMWALALMTPPQRPRAGAGAPADAVPAAPVPPAIAPPKPEPIVAVPPPAAPAARPRPVRPVRPPRPRPRPHRAKEPR